MYNLHQFGLAVHFIALFLLGGGSVGSVLLEKQVWKKAVAGSPEGRYLLPVMIGATRLIKIGAILFLASGILLVGSVHWIYFRQPWFIAKVILFFALAARGAMVAEPIFKETVKALDQETPDAGLIKTLRFRMNRFHLVQYILSLLIVFLVLFKP